MKIIYFIIPTANLTQEMINDSVETSAFTLRYNNNNTKVILKYNLNKIPLSLTLLYPDSYNHTEILLELQKPEWNY